MPPPRSRPGRGPPLAWGIDDERPTVDDRAGVAGERVEWGSAYAAPLDDNGDLVFTREDGAPLDPGRTHSEFIRLVRDAGLSHLKLHGLRPLKLWSG